MEANKGNVKAQKQRRQQRQQSLPKFECPCGSILTPTDENIRFHRKTTRHLAWETETGFPTQQILTDIQMKKSSWITALKQWNEGKPMWCIPRKNTSQYQEVLALKLGGTPAVTFHPDTTETITLPTIPVPTKRRVRRSVVINLNPVPVQEVEPPVAAPKPKPARKRFAYEGHPDLEKMREDWIKKSRELIHKQDTMTAAERNAFFKEERKLWRITADGRRD